jgi:DNA-binding HxlR family transcriptional regulator
MFALALDLIKPTWAPEIIFILQSGPLRHTDLMARLYSTADRPVHNATFNRTLKALQDEGIVEHHTNRAPPDYALTASGRQLAVVLNDLQTWYQSHPARTRHRRTRRP